MFDILRHRRLYSNFFPSFNISIWAVALCAHAACKNFAGLFVVRLILGMCEGSITAGFLIVSSMFYTRKEQTLRVGYWCKLSSYIISLCDMRIYRFDSFDERHRCGRYSSLHSSHLIASAAQIITGFISFGSLHIKTKAFEPWQW